MFLRATKKSVECCNGRDGGTNRWHDICHFYPCLLTPKRLSISLGHLSCFDRFSWCKPLGQLCESYWCLVWSSVGLHLSSSSTLYSYQGASHDGQIDWKNSDLELLVAHDHDLCSKICTALAGALLSSQYFTPWLGTWRWYHQIYRSK